MTVSPKNHANLNTKSPSTLTLDSQNSSTQSYPLFFLSATDKKYLRSTLNEILDKGILVNNSSFNSPTSPLNSTYTSNVNQSTDAHSTTPPNVTLPPAYADFIDIFNDSHY